LFGGLRLGENPGTRRHHGIGRNRKPIAWDQLAQRHAQRIGPGRLPRLRRLIDIGSDDPVRLNPYLPQQFKPAGTGGA